MDISIAKEAAGHITGRENFSIADFLKKYVNPAAIQFAANFLDIVDPARTLGIKLRTAAKSVWVDRFVQESRSAA